MGKGPKPPKVDPPPPVPQVTDPAVEDAARRARQAEGKRKGRRSTLLTGGQGVTEDANVAKKTLLGQ